MIPAHPKKKTNKKKQVQALFLTSLPLPHPLLTFVLFIILQFLRGYHVHQTQHFGRGLCAAVKLQPWNVNWQGHTRLLEYLRDQGVLGAHTGSLHDQLLVAKLHPIQPSNGLAARVCVCVCVCVNVFLCVCGACITAYHQTNPEGNPCPKLLLIH